MQLKTTKYPFFEVVGDGGISSDNLGEGRFIPSVIIDIEEHSSIADLIKMHSSTPPGDAVFQWSRDFSIFKPQKLHLNIDFVKPMQLSFGIVFDLPKQFAIIDGIIQSKGLYLQTGKEGDKISEFKTESILFEVPETGFEREWDKILLETVKTKYKKLGATKNEVKVLSQKHIKSMREMWNIRR
jgi:hypothetical protein